MIKENIVVPRTDVKDRKLCRLFNATIVSKHWIRAIIRQHERDEKNSLYNNKDEEAILIPHPSKHITKKSHQVLRQLRGMAIRANSLKTKEHKLGENHNSLLIEQADHLVQTISGLVIGLKIFLESETSVNAENNVVSGLKSWKLEEHRDLVDHAQACNVQWPIGKIRTYSWTQRGRINSGGSR